MKLYQMCAAQLDEWTVSVFLVYLHKTLTPWCKAERGGACLAGCQRGLPGCQAGAGLSPSSRPVHRSRQQPSPSGVSPASSRVPPLRPGWTTTVLPLKPFKSRSSSGSISASAPAKYGKAKKTKRGENEEIRSKEVLL